MEGSLFSTQKSKLPPSPLQSWTAWLVLKSQRPKLQTRHSFGKSSGEAEPRAPRPSCSPSFFCDSGLLQVKSQLVMHGHKILEQLHKKEKTWGTQKTCKRKQNQSCRGLTGHCRAGMYEKRPTHTFHTTATAKVRCVPHLRYRQSWKHISFFFSSRCAFF